MKKLRYRLRLTGLPEEQGQIGLLRLTQLLDAFRKTAERATRLAAEGKGGSGSKPAWLQATMDFTVAGMESGSTVLVIDAPPLRETAYRQFAQEDFWLERPDLDGTAVDITVSAVNEAVSETSHGDHFDSSVLDAILALKKSVGDAGIGVELRREGSDGVGFKLNEQRFRQVERHRRNTPLPRMCLVSGRLDEIRHGGGRFRILLGGRSSLLGRLQNALDPEVLRPLWGKPVLVEGQTYFKANEKPRMIEASKVVKYEQEDNFFRKLPVPEESDTSELRSKTRKKSRHTGGFDPLTLAGSWPGDESFDELVADLD